MLKHVLSAVALLLGLLVTTGRAQVRVRLVGGPSPLEGRLEVYYNDRWGTVCYDQFTSAAANVVCYMLGREHSGRYIRNRYGAGSGTIWLNNVICNGTETNIADCQHGSWGYTYRSGYWSSRSCTHDMDVSVSCITVRLLGYYGQQGREGRLEVYHSGRWGTVCDDYFNNSAASVVCYMLGYEGAGQFIGNHYGYGDGTIWLDDVQCSGSESSLANCRHRPWGSHDCQHSQDVSVSCFNEVRLVGYSGSRGRLEVYHNSRWGTVCNNGFTDAAARVVCYSLGYGRTGRVIGNAYGAGSGRIWLDNIRCSGSESHITECPHKDWGRHSCSHSDDVSVSCVADSAEAVALVGGGNPRVGRLEVFHGTQWGTVCDHGFTDAAARVVCYSLGFGYVGRKVDINLYGIGEGLIWLNNISCNGSEQHIGECSYDDWGVQSCDHHQDVAVSCNLTTSITGVRLVGGSISTGRLEVLHDGVWGTVCGDFFSAAEARVVCRMLGFASGNKTDNRNYITSHGPIWLDQLGCNGTERDIAECSHNGWGVHNCQHRDDVVLSCARTKMEVRLNGGRDPRQGRLEVFHNGTWGTVCRYGLDYATTRVVCYMLGFGYIGRTITDYGHENVTTWLGSLSCGGEEQSIDECTYHLRVSSYCLSSEYRAVVSCLRDNAVALFGGESPREGRLEVYHNGRWGTVCDDRFTDAAARVVCYSLGFGYVGREMNIDKYGAGKGQIWLDDVECEGMERHINECSHRPLGAHNCGHYEDVAVSCVDDLSETSVTPFPFSSALSSSSPASITTTPKLPTFHKSTSFSTYLVSRYSSTSPSTSRTTPTPSPTSTPGFSTSSTTRTSSPSSPTNFPAVSTLSSTSHSTSTALVSSPTSTSSRTLIVSSPRSTATATSTAASPTSIGDSTGSIQSGSDHTTADLTQIIVAAIVVVGLIICVVVVGVVVVHVHQKPRRERTDVAMTPMPVTASANSCNNSGFADAAGYENSANNAQASDNNANSDFQQPSAPVAGAVGDVRSGNDYFEPSVMLLDDQGRRPQVQPSYETLK